MKHVALLVSLLMIAVAGNAMADETEDATDVAAASKAFTRAQKAMLSGDYSQAADLYELADSLAPSAAALRSAVRARYAAGHKATAATEAAELLRRYPADAESRRFAKQILDELTPSLAHVTVRCSSPCTMEVEGKAVAVAEGQEHAFFVVPGKREIAATFDNDARATKSVTLQANESTRLRFKEPPTAVAQGAIASPPMHESHGIARHWAIGTGVVAIGLGLTATGFGLSTLAARDDIREKVRTGQQAAAERAYDDAEQTQLLTNIFIGGAAIAGVTTVALALFTDWSGDASAETLQVQAGRGGGSVLYVGRF